MRMGIVLAALISAASVPATAAEPGTLSGGALRKAVTGKVVYLRTQGVEVPIAYRGNGTMSGRLRAFVAALAGGTSPTDSGRWWISNDQLCQRWNRWLDGKAYCYRLRRDGGTVYWQRNDGRRGTARIGS